MLPFVMIGVLALLVFLCVAGTLSGFTGRSQH